MSWRVLEITTNGTYISKNRGSLCIKPKNAEETLIPFSDIQTLILATDGITITSGAINELTANCSIILFVNDKYEPSSLVYPTKNNFFLRKRLLQQIDLSVPLQKKIWQETIKMKIFNQAENLKICGLKYDHIKDLIPFVKSGDSTNVEAEAAKKYWQTLFTDFSRSDETLGINSMLNYGYAILRSGVARALASSGLNLTLGLHHINLENDFCLVDDIMEPYRPFVDKIVFNTKKPASHCFDLTPELKRTLVTVLSTEVIFENQNTSLSNALLKTAQSFCDCIEKKTDALKFAEFIN